MFVVVLEICAESIMGPQTYPPGSWSCLCAWCGPGPFGKQSKKAPGRHLDGEEGWGRGMVPGCHTPVGELMKAYCEPRGSSVWRIRFHLARQPVMETDTPAQRATECEDSAGASQPQMESVY